MEMPQYRPKLLNGNPEYGKLVTCYGYAALDIQPMELPVLAAMARAEEQAGGRWGGPQPGMLAKHNDPYLVFPATTWQSDMMVKSRLDGVIPHQGPDMPLAREGYFVCAVFSETPSGGAVHLVRRDDAKTAESDPAAAPWSHKYDFGPVTDLDDFGGKLIGDPRQAQWKTCGVFKGFFYAPRERPLFLPLAAQPAAQRQRLAKTMDHFRRLIEQTNPSDTAMPSPAALKPGPKI